MEARWFGPHVAYTMAKFGMSMCVLGMAEEFRGKVAVNALWPRTAIDTDAMNVITGPDFRRRCRKPEIMADAAHVVLTRPAKTRSGNFLLTDDVLAEDANTDLT